MTIQFSIHIFAMTSTDFEIAFKVKKNMDFGYTIEHMHNFYEKKFLVLNRIFDEYYKKFESNTL